MPKIVDAGERRAELADAASRVIARAGISGASLREVAAEAGWTTGALSHYFTNKQALLAFTLEASLERVRSQRSEVPERTPDQDLRALLISILPITPDLVLHWVVTLAFTAHAATDPELGVIQRDAYRSFRSSVAGLLDRGALDVSAERHDVERAAERVITVVDGIAVQALFDPELWTAERQIAALDDGLHLVARAVEFER